MTYHENEFQTPPHKTYILCMVLRKHIEYRLVKFYFGGEDDKPLPCFGSWF